jgi:hypothetical protein
MTTEIKNLFAAAKTPALAISASHDADMNGNGLLALALADHCRLLKARAAGDTAAMIKLSQSIGSALRMLA